MLASWRPAGVSFGLRLFTLLLIPLLGLGVLAVQRIDDERAAAATALALVEDARLQQDVAAVHRPAQLEQIALEGLAVIDALGFPRDLVVTVAGVDFEGTYDENAVELDSALDVLDERLGDVASGEQPALAGQLSEFRGQLANQRELSAGRRATQENVRAVFAALDLVLTDAVESTRLQATNSDPVPPTDERVELAALNQVLETARDRGLALLDAFDGKQEENRTSNLLRASTRLDFAIEQFRSLLDDEQLAALDTATDELRPVPTLLLAPAGDASPATDFDPTYIAESAQATLDQLAFLAALGVYSDSFHTQVVTDLEARATTAKEAKLRTQLLVAMTAAVSALVLVALSWSTLRPLRRLTRRARSIGAGAFDATPLPIRGPSDVRTLTNTMNSMAATLEAIDEEIADLASGAPVGHGPALPGPIGVSLDRSFQRLETMTVRLHESEQLASAIVAQAADAIWTIDEHGIITSANEASIALIEVPADQQIGRPLDVFVPQFDGEVTIQRASGESTRVLVSSSAIDGGAGPLTTVIAHDISERMRFEERLAYQAHHDALTGLPNRFAVLDTLSAAEPNQSVAILFVDLDGFKSVNDTQGHLLGDRVLTEVGQRLSALTRPGDFGGRLGGDEFVLIMHDPQDENEAVSFGYRIIAELEQPYRHDEHVFALSASVGVAMFSNGLAADRLTPLEAIRRADSAVYAAKRRGRGRVELFDARLQQQMVHDAEVELALRDAVRRNELELHLQPIYDVTEGRFTGAEALARWNRPGAGMVPPGEFIPIAEKSSTIDEIGRWVLTEACATLARWSRDQSTRELKIAVNIAGSHLLDGDFIGDLDVALLRSGADPSRLELELTETQILDDHERAAVTLHDVRRRGIAVAIDDFGTGYSSMAYLRELPVDTLKIDQTFVHPLSSPGADTTVVDALVTIGHALGLSIVAEGVEDADQLDYLIRLGCDRIQGFLLALPMPVADAEQLMVTGPGPAGPSPDSAAARHLPPWNDSAPVQFCVEDPGRRAAPPAERSTGARADRSGRPHAPTQPI